MPRPTILPVSLLLLFTASCSPGKGAGPTSPAPHSPKSEHVIVSCVGEQTTHSAHRENDPEYPTRLAGILGDKFEVLNRGLPKGRVLRQATAPESESYFDSKPFAQRLSDLPNIAVIGPWGRHDTYPGNWPEHKDEFSGDLRALVEPYLALTSHPTVFVVTPLPFNGETDHAISELLAPTRALADELSLPVVDLWDAFLGHPEWYKDGTHLTPEGQQRQAELVAQAILDHP